MSRLIANKTIGTVASSGGGGGGGGSLEAVASGTLANGDTVVINSDGTVSAVAGSSLFVVGASATFETGGFNQYHVSCYDQHNDKVIVFYQDTNNSNYATAVVGTVAANNTISFGTPVVVHSNSSRPLSVVYHAAHQKLIFSFFISSNNYGAQMVGAVSGTSLSITAGLNYPFPNGNTSEADQLYDPNSGNVVLLAKDGSNSNKMTAIVCVLNNSTNALTYGTKVTLDGSTSTFYPRLATDGSGVCLALFDAGYLYGIMLTISGTSITAGSAHTIEGSSMNSRPDVEWLPSVSRFAVAYNRSNRGYIRLRSISGTGSSATTVHAAEAEIPQYDNAANPTIVYHTAIGHPYVTYSHNSEISMRKATCSASSVSYGSRETIANTSTHLYPTSLYDPDQQKIIVTNAQTQQNKSETRVINPTGITTNLTSENYIGISDAAYTNGQTATVQITGSVDDAQSGLTAGQQYYVQFDGSVSTSADDPIVFAGTAVSATKLIVKG